MAKLARIGIAIDEDLLDGFDKLIAKRGYANRSEAFRDLVRNELVTEFSGSPDADSGDRIDLRSPCGPAGKAVGSLLPTYCNESDGDS